jgi:polyribonucleotide nucleotidyltransferase
VLQQIYADQAQERIFAQRSKLPKGEKESKMGQTINPLGKKITSVTTEFCGRKLELEVGRVGFRSTASVIARYGDTVVLATAMVGDKPVQGFDYFPLSIDYEEKMYAAGKISGSRFIKREGRPSDDAI